MQLGLTIPLQKHLKIKLPPLSAEQMPDLAFCWDLHLVNWGGKRGLIMVNSNSRYAIWLHPMRAADWKRLPELAMEQIERALFEDEAELPEEWIERYLQAGGVPELTGTHGKKPVGALNQAVEKLFFCDPSEEDEEGLEHPGIDYCLNRGVAHAAGFTGYGYPVEFLQQDLERLFGEGAASE